jgi:hypothetical protein
MCFGWCCLAARRLQTAATESAGLEIFFLRDAAIRGKEHFR